MFQTNNKKTSKHKQIVLANKTIEAEFFVFEPQVIISPVIRQQVCNY